LKGLLEENDETVPKIHDLDDLCKSLLPLCPTLRSVRRGLVFLKRFAVEVRYVGEDATKREAVAAVRWTGKVRAKARDLLGLPLHGK
jgi:hypothetical protein